MSKRNDFRLIGDPHITRKFEVGVPLARKGEREKSLFKDFESRMYAGDERIVIMVGDLFEKPICSLKDAYNAYKIILDAAQNQPHRLFLMMAGNHDISPEEENFGAFDILGLFDGKLSNLRIVRKPEVFDGIALFPWEWDRTALEQLEDVKYRNFDVAVGHWDLVAYDDMHVDHFCPALKLQEMGAKEIHSGHWHVAGDYKVEGVTVHCTGSMQPMTHAEDPKGDLYVTLTLEEYESTDPETLKNKYVRVQLEQGEEVDTLTDCLGFKVQKLTPYAQEHEEVEISDFSAKDVIRKNLEKHEVPEEVSAFIEERIDASD